MSDNIKILKTKKFIKNNGNYFSNKTTKLKMVDLFAGTGGFTIAFDKTQKVNIVMANDFCKNSKKIYNYNFPQHNFINDDLNNIKTKDIPEHDILTAGFPCQPFSIAGNQKGFKDKRSNVFWKILDIMKQKTPRFVVLENVKNIQSHDKGNTFKIIIDEITKLGYSIKYQILDTSLITSIPQHRERIYIVCFKYKKDYHKFNFDITPIKKVKKINKFLETKVDNKFYYTDKLKVYDTLVSNVTKDIVTDVVYQYRRYYVRENKSGLCPTLTANMGTGGHNVPIIKDKKGIRKFTPKECFNLQGFPIDYKLPVLSSSALYKLSGNAISVPVAEIIAQKILNTI